MGSEGGSAPVATQVALSRERFLNDSKRRPGETKPSKSGVFQILSHQRLPYRYGPNGSTEWNYPYPYLQLTDSGTGTRYPYG